MVKIFKYQMKLEDGPQTFLMPISARVVAVQNQYNVVCFWALCNPEEKQTERNFHIFGTGHHIPNAGLKYLGTVQQMEGRLVWHVFEDIGHGATS